jgi:hypothetical protein
LNERNGSGTHQAGQEFISLVKSQGSQKTNWLCEEIFENIADLHGSSEHRLQLFSIARRLAADERSGKLMENGRSLTFSPSFFFFGMALLNLLPIRCIHPIVIQKKLPE